MFILASGRDLPRGRHYFNHPKDGVHRHPLTGEVYDSMLRDSVALVGDGDEVVDFVDGSGVSAGAACGEDVGHIGLRFQEPTQSSIEILLCKQ